MWSCVEDLAKWLVFQFREDGGVRKDTQVLAGPTLKEMHNARYIGNDDWTQAWCISWYAVRRENVIWLQHSGGLPGFITDICFDPKHEVGAIALINGIGDAPALAMDLATIARDAVRSAAPAIEPPTSLPEAYRPLLGMYADQEFGTLVRLEWRDAKLSFIDPNNPAWRPTLARTDDPDIFLVELGARESGEQVVFRRVADGRVVSVFLAATTFVRLDRVVESS
jgi:hypothetical protein